jgi:hypothetical protein
MVTVMCAAAGAQGGLPLGATCNPLSISVTAATAVQGNLTVSLGAPSPSNSAMLAPGIRDLRERDRTGQAWIVVSAGTGIGSFLFLLFGGKSRYRAALGLGLLCVFSFTLGCGGYAGGGGGGGPVATTTKLSVTPGTKNPTQVTITVTPYSGAAAQGSVQLSDGSAPLGGLVTINNGVATVNTALTAVGTHGLSAQYMGSATDSTSQSGVLNVSVTGGPVQVAITGTSGANTASGNVGVTIN